MPRHPVTIFIGYVAKHECARDPGPRGYKAEKRVRLRCNLGFGLVPTYDRSLEEVGLENYHP